MRARHRAFNAAAGLALICSVLAAPTPAGAYTLTPLGTLGGSTSQAWDVNDLGQVVGDARTSSGDTHAFFWSGGVMTDLGTLGGNYSRAYAVNNLGQIVGESSLANGEVHAFLYQNGIMQDLSIGAGTAVDINNAGIIIGREGISGPSPNNTGAWAGNAPGFIWNSGSVTLLSSLMPFAPSFANPWADEINNAGVLSGRLVYGPNFSQPYQAMSFDLGTNALSTLQSPANSSAVGINGLGDLVGFTNGDCNVSGFIANASGSNVIANSVVGTCSSSTYDINDSKQALIASGPFAFDTLWLYDEIATSLVNITSVLATKGASNCALNDDPRHKVEINNLGDIAGGCVIDDQFQAFLLSADAIPEPSSLALFASAIVAASTYRRRQPIR
jgi:probable HAF family extracellular repeat protein